LNIKLKKCVIIQYNKIKPVLRRRGGGGQRPHFEIPFKKKSLKTNQF
jgi:hypothetical protein